MPGDDGGRLLPGDDEVKVRLYGQGLGDCFLLAFPRPGQPDDPCYLLIDCGAAKSTPGREERARTVVRDIAAATGGHLDVLAVTHQHFDHISGFADAWDEWQRIQVDSLVLPWTESNAPVGDHTTVRRLREALEEAARRAVRWAAREEALPAGSPLRAEADFLGVDLAAAAAPFAVAASMDETMELVRSLCPSEAVRYLEPGDVFRLPGTECHGYVLGPPLPTETRGKKRLIELLVDEDDEVMYSYRQLGMPLDEGIPGRSRSFAIGDDHGLPALASALSAAESIGRAGDDGFAPFGERERLPWEDAMATGFFGACYGDEKRGENGTWRRIDYDWLAGAGSLALRAGGYTNNLSLVLAFDLPKGEKMLLFPGDAQVGNWLSWHSIEDWRFLDGGGPARPPAEGDGRTVMQDLLARVAFYKVGHHGSHNATIRRQGLEAMTRPDLVAYVPVSVPVAQDAMGYCPMPFYPVLRALHRRTAGRVFLPNGHALRAGRSDERTDEELLAEAGIVASEQTLPPLPQAKGSPPERFPLYLELTAADGASASAAPRRRGSRRAARGG